MRRIVSFTILCIFIFFSCSNEDKLPENVPESGYKFASFREIPDITAEEIAAIEELQNQYDKFVFGMPFSIEAFEDLDGEIKGFSALFCGWLSDFFEIPFQLKLFEWSDIFAGLESGDIDFSGEVTVTEEREKIYYFSGDIASRPVKYFTLESAKPYDEILKERPLRCGFIQGTTVIDIVVPELAPGTFEIVLLEDMSFVYDALVTNKIDAFFYSGAAEAYFIKYSDMVSGYFYPLSYLTVSFTAQKPDLKPVVSVIDKVLENNGLQFFVSLYNQGEQDYLRYKLNMQLTEEERLYLKENPIVKIGIDPDNYPGSFYDKRENVWSGIHIDILNELSVLTGLSFELVNDEQTPWKEIFSMLEEGSVSLAPGLVQSPELMDRFLWTVSSDITDYYALISGLDYPNLKINEVLYAKIGLIRDTAPAVVFNKWFPHHTNTVFYERMEDAIDGLKNGEIEMIMTTQMRLLYLTHYLEQPNYTANIVFDYPVYIKFGFNKNEDILQSIIDKALGLLDTTDISGRWIHKTYDYRSKMVETQIPWLFGVVVLTIVLSFLTIAFVKRKAALESAKAADKSKSAFLANMSHEIRTPMNSIVGFSELAMDDKISPKTMDYLKKIKTNSEWLLQIINDILDLSKIESGKMELEIIPFDLQEILESCRIMVMPKAEEKGVELIIDSEPPGDRILRGDPTRLRQVFLNLLSNAIKFTKKGSVKLEAKLTGKTDNTVTISFCAEDSGIGITPEQIKKIYEPFMQAETGTTRKYGGTGLGLPISKNIIEMMGGKLLVESMPGKGTKFSFDLTFETIVAPEENGENGENEGNNVEKKAKKASLKEIPKPHFDGEVLLCEDNAMNQQVIYEHLSRVGLKTVIAENGKIGVDMVRSRQEKNEKQFDLIFMDIHMPVMDGLEASAEILRLNTGIPLIAMTANIMSGETDTYKESGMTDCIGKPFTSQELWRCLLKYLKPLERAKIDTAHEDELAELEKKITLKLKLMFYEKNKNLYEEFTKSLKDGELKAAYRMMHNLKSNAGQIGLHSLQAIAKDIEAALKGEINTVSPHQLSLLKNELNAAFLELQHYIDEEEKFASK